MRLGLAVALIAVRSRELAGLAVDTHGGHVRIEHAFEQGAGEHLRVLAAGRRQSDPHVGRLDA